MSYDDTSVWASFARVFRDMGGDFEHIAARPEGVLFDTTVAVLPSVDLAVYVRRIDIERDPDDVVRRIRVALRAHGVSVPRRTAWVTRSPAVSAERPQASSG